MMKTEKEIKEAIKKIDRISDEFGEMYGQGWCDEMLAFRCALEWVLEDKELGK